MANEEGTKSGFSRRRFRPNPTVSWRGKSIICRSGEEASSRNLFDSRASACGATSQSVYSIFPASSSMLPPKSFSITAAALRPALPFTEPPGTVHAPV